MSMAYAPLITKAGKVMTNLGKDLTGVQFSIIEDQLGSCAKTRHAKLSGPMGTQQTGTIVELACCPNDANYTLFTWMFLLQVGTTVCGSSRELKNIGMERIPSTIIS